MSILFIIPYHYLDSVIWLRDTVKQLRQHGDVVVITDYGVGNIRMYVHDVIQLEPLGMGVGRARDLGIKYGVKQGYDCLIFMDSHMVVPENIDQLCKEKIAQPAIVAVDVHTGGIRKEEGILGDFLGEYSWKWYYILSTTKRKSIMTAQSVFSLQRDVAEALISANNGWYTQCLYWGTENFDPTLSASRLGFDLTLFPEMKVGHVFKEGSSWGWKRRFTRRMNDRYEPWHGKVVTKYQYQFGIEFAKAVFALKHYSLEEIKNSELYMDPTAVKIVLETDWIVNSINEFNKNAKYTRRQAYDRLKQYLSGAIIAEAGHL